MDAISSKQHCADASSTADLQADLSLVEHSNVRSEHLCHELVERVL